MSAPVEFRLFMKRWERHDALMGLQFVRDGNELYHTPCFQYRYKMRMKQDGDFVMVWSEWQDVPLVKEGQEPLTVAPDAA